MTSIKRSISLEQAIQGFILFRRAEGFSEGTIKIYEWTFERLIRYLGDGSEKRELSSISSDEIQKFYLWLQTGYKPSGTQQGKLKLAPSSVEKAWSTLRSFYRWAEEELKIPRADQTIKRPKYKAKEIQPLTEDEIKALLKGCAYMREAKTNTRKAFTMRRSTANRDTALILLLLDTGLRVSECGRLNIRDVNSKTGEIFVDAYGTGQKTKSRHVYLGQKALKALWHYLADRKGELRDDDPLFISRDGKRMDKNSIRLLLTDLGARTGVKNVHPHRFRHTFSIQYLRNGGDVFTLQRLLGHSTLTMVQHYLSIVSADVQSVHRRASPADRWEV